MKRLRIAVCVLLLALVPVGAQGLHTVYLPLVDNPAEACGDRIPQMGVWSFIRPAGTINYVRNPSFEEDITTAWANYSTGAAAGVRNRSTGYSKFGHASLYLQKTAGAEADQWGKTDTLGITSVSGQAYVASVWVRCIQSATLWIALVKSTGVGVYQAVSASVTGPLTGWVRLETDALTANATGDAMVVYVFISGTATTSAWFDAVQVEARSTTTTYCDGDQLGCEWLGAAHNSNSQRSAQSRAGGVVVDFDDMEFDIQGMIGAGMSPIGLNVDSYAILPGGELNSQKTGVRPFSLTGWITGTSLENLHANRQALVDEFKPNARAGKQPVVLRYTGAAVDKEISAYYETGLEGRIRGDFTCLEQNVALRFLATDPDFYELGESAAILDSNDADANRRNVAARLRSTGQWDTLGPPNAAGTYTAIDAVVVGPDGTVYYGGTFTNFDNIAAADYIVSYTPSTGVWAAVGGGLSAQVNGLAFGPDGSLYAVGRFLNAGGVANADYIARWNGAAWSAVGNPNQGAAAIVDIFDLAFDRSGNLYVTGDFANLANIANADYVAMWDGAAWNAVGAPAAGAAAITLVDPIAIDSQGNVYVGGVFTTFANITGADYIAVWVPGAANWYMLAQLNAFVSGLVAGPDDTIYLSGNFTNAGGVATADRIASWNKTAMSALGTGLTGGADRLVFAPDGLLYAAGGFATAGGLTVPGIAVWNGASWAHVDFDFTGGSITELAIGPADPVVEQNYDLWVGWNTTGTLNYAGLVTVDNEGTEEAYPRFLVSRSGGTSATLYGIRNETTGKVLWFAYSLLDGEELTIDLAPTQKSIVSSFFGPRPDALLPNSDFGEWALLPGENDVSCFVDVAGAPTVVVAMIWRDAYWSAD